VGDTELEFGARLDRDTGWQSGGVQEYFAAVIARDEAEALFLVVELDPAGRHLPRLSLPNSLRTTVSKIAATGCLLAYGYPETVPNVTAPESSRFDRFMAFTIVALVVASVLSFVAVIVATQFG